MVAKWHNQIIRQANKSACWRNLSAIFIRQWPSSRAAAGSCFGTDVRTVFAQRCCESVHADQRFDWKNLNFAEAHPAFNTQRIFFRQQKNWPGVLHQ